MTTATALSEFKAKTQSDMTLKEATAIIQHLDYAVSNYGPVTLTPRQVVVVEVARAKVKESGLARLIDAQRQDASDALMARMQEAVAKMVHLEPRYFVQVSTDFPR